MALWLQEPAAETPPFIFWPTGNRNRTGRGPGCITSRFVPKVSLLKFPQPSKAAPPARDQALNHTVGEGVHFTFRSQQRVTAKGNDLCHRPQMPSGAFLACDLVQRGSLNDSRGSYLVTRMLGRIQEWPGDAYQMCPRIIPLQTS